MSENAAVDIHALIAAGRVVEAGTLLAMHGEELPPDMRQELEQERQRLWQRASDLVSEGEALEQAGWTEEAWTTYQKAAKIACDFPGIQETLKRLDETVALTKAVQHRSKRIRAHIKKDAPKKNHRGLARRIFAGVLLLGCGGFLWHFLNRPHSPPQPPPASLSQTVIQAPPSEEAPSPAATTTQPSPVAAEQSSSSQAAITDEQKPVASIESLPMPIAAPPAPAPNPQSGLPATPMPSSAPPPPTNVAYTVQAGDSLNMIAERLYCNGEAWQVIYKKNKTIIQHPDKLTPGMELKLGNIENRCPKPQQ